MGSTCQSLIRGTMISFCLIIFALLASANSQEPQGSPRTRNMTLFPPCMDDDNCEEISKQKNADFQCFQYMCFPWDNDDLTDGFNTCRDSTDCKKSEECFRHWNARK